MLLVVDSDDTFGTLWWISYYRDEGGVSRFRLFYKRADITRVGLFIPRRKIINLIIKLYSDLWLQSYFPGAVREKIIVAICTYQIELLSITRRVVCSTYCKNRFLDYNYFIGRLQL